MDESTTEGAGKARYHHGDLKTALVDAAVRIIEKTRVEAFSVADAARAAGVSSGAPYRHFHDRDELLDHVAARGFEEMRARNMAAFESQPEGAIEAIVAGGCSYVEFAAERPELFHLMWGATRPTAPDGVARERGDLCYQGFLGALRSTMEGQGLGHLDTPTFGAPLWAMVHGFASLAATRNRKVGDLAAIRERIAAATHAYFAGYSRKS